MPPGQAAVLSSEETRLGAPGGPWHLQFAEQSLALGWRAGCQLSHWHQSRSQASPARATRPSSSEGALLVTGTEPRPAGRLSVCFLFVASLSGASVLPKEDTQRICNEMF